MQPTVLAVRNEDLIANFSAETAAIARFLKLEDATPLAAFDRHARAKGFIGTPTYAQVVQPINANGVGRWRSYRRYIDPVLPILDPMLRRWNYAT
jgi:hypothetical protein